MFSLFFSKKNPDESVFFKKNSFFQKNVWSITGIHQRHPVSPTFIIYSVMEEIEFSDYLYEHAVPEWREKYLNFDELRRLVARLRGGATTQILAARKASAQRPMPDPNLHVARESKRSHVRFTTTSSGATPAASYFPESIGVRHASGLSAESRSI